MANRILSDDEDLFGDDSDTKSDTQQKTTNLQDELFGDSPSPSPPVHDKEERQEEREDSDRRDEEDYNDREEERDGQEIVQETEIVDYSGHKGNPDLYLLKLPNFLDIQSEPFDPSKFEELDQDSILQTSIRWRNPKNPESNTRLIRWSDNTFSLLVGDEMFDAATTTIDSRHQYLTTQHPSSLIFKLQAKFDKFMSFTPSGTDSLAHKKLMLNVVKKHEKVAKSKQYIVLEDPEQQIREAEKAENERLKARRKLEAKKLASMKFDDQPRYSYHKDNRGYDLDEEGEDEEEFEKVDEEEMAERLLNAKRTVIDEPEVRSKRLRIIEDSDDD